MQEREIIVICPLGLLSSRILKTTIECVLLEMGLSDIRVRIRSVEQASHSRSQVCFASRVLASALCGVFSGSELFLITDLLDKSEVRHALISALFASATTS